MASRGVPSTQISLAAVPLIPDTKQVTKAGPWMMEKSPFTFARRVSQCLGHALSLWLLEPHTCFCVRKGEMDIQLWPLGGI